MSDTDSKRTQGKIQRWAQNLKRDLTALRIALEDKALPWYVHFLIILTIGYALSPIDLIPDVIPILGLLDDLIIIPALIYIILKLIPSETMAKYRIAAELKPVPEKKNWIAAAIIVSIWLLLTIWIGIVISKKW